MKIKQNIFYQLVICILIASILIGERSNFIKLFIYYFFFSVCCKSNYLKKILIFFSFNSIFLNSKFNVGLK